MGQPFGFPSQKQPFVDRVGLITQVWLQFLQQKLSAIGNLTIPIKANEGGTGQTVYTDGELLIGDSGSGGLDKATLTAGSGVSIINGPGKITIAASEAPGGGVTAIPPTTPGTLAKFVSATQITSAGLLGGESWIPLVLGTEPPVFVTDSAGHLILTAYP